ncbi:phosphotransferase [Pseudooceanicola algae]|uniref:Aminoglycoside phosphotransferase domain-containing protein n=1 Tax=Pseudooceanicola algae TaxID=1537215 RepID=A0A418SB88_9RHOB|nr:phosphotransferase [Pseudooceanicola algae]QPM91382.1 hypothetical protein PSAL_026350 [Pseudooceanicola algae]
MTSPALHPAKVAPEAAIAAAELAETLLGDANAELSQILRLRPQRGAIFSGHYRGRSAIFHLALSPHVARAQLRGVEEATRLRGYMAEGLYRVPEPLGLLDDGTLRITARAGGRPVLEFLMNAKPRHHADVAPRMAGWLLHHATPTLRWRAVNRGPWRKWAAESATKQRHPDLIEPEARLLDLMQRLSHRLEGDWRVSLAHGDFHPNNLIWNRGRDILWGIDISASSTAPIYRDMARNLVHAARRGVLPSGQRLFGVDRATVEAFCDAFDMSPAERDGFLPYFLCYETLIRVEDETIGPRRIATTREMTLAMIEDIESLLT